MSRFSPLPPRSLPAGGSLHRGNLRQTPLHRISLHRISLHRIPLHRALFLGALLPGVLLLGACGGGGETAEPGGPPGSDPGGAPPPMAVLAAPAERATAAIEVEAVGSLRSPETSVIAADVSGLLVELDAPEGGQVQKGHVLARIDATESRASLQVAEARERNALATYERVEPLVADGVIPKQALDDAAAELDTARALVAEARAALGKHAVLAPFTGVLSIGTAKLGEHVSAGTAIARLTRMDPLELVFTVPEESAGRTRVGQTVTGRVGRCGERFEARVTALDPALDASTRTLAILARVPNPELRLRPGMSAQVRLAVGEQTDALQVPHEALVREGTRYVLWVIDDDGTASPRTVTVGSFFPASVEITSGLDEGEQVVVAGHQKLRPGAPVAPEPWQATENPKLELGAAPDDDCQD
jgi:membrane fusion protein, multidrug efflux system